MFRIPPGELCNVSSVALGIAFATLVWSSDCRAEGPSGDASSTGGVSPPVPASMERDAVRLGHEALELYQAGRWDDAYDRFATAAELAHSPVFVLYMARCRRNSGKLLEAKALFVRTATERLAGDEPVAWTRAVADAGAEQSALERNIPRLVIAVRGAEIGSYRVELDGVELPPDTIAKPVDLDPGLHRVGVRDARGRETSRSLDLAEGQGEVAVELDLDAPPRHATAPTQGAKQREYGADPGTPYRIGGYSLIGLGTVGLAVGATTGVLAAQASSDFKKNCVGDSCLESDADKGDEAKRWATWSTLSFVAGGVSLAAGVTLLLVSPKKNGDPKRAISLDLRLAPASVRLDGRF